MLRDVLTTFDDGRSDVILFSRTFQGEEPVDTGGGRVFSLDAAFGLLATASASALELFSRLCAQLLWCELYNMRD